MPKVSRKDPNKPKGAKSAYIFFVESERAEQENRAGGNLPFSEFSKQCGVRWGELNDDQKAPFMEMSRQDRTRYDEEMVSYVPPPHLIVKMGENGSEEETLKKKKKQKKEKDPNAPKKALSAYFIYAGRVRADIRTENPEMAITQVAQVIGEKWRQLSAEDRKEFEEEAARDKVRYQTQLQQYTEHGTF